MWWSMVGCECGRERQKKKIELGDGVLLVLELVACPAAQDSAQQGSLGEECTTSQIECQGRVSRRRTVSR